MTIIRHEIRQGRTSFWIWTASIAFLVMICVFMYPEMGMQADEVNAMFASMGSFTAAFGMDRLNLGTLIGFYGIECGNILGMGGAFYAAALAVAALSKEEKEHTAEFLLTHPVTRVRVITEKLAAVAIQIVAMNVIVYIASVLSVAAIGEAIPWREITLLHAANLLMQLELAGICFGISAFLRRGSLGIGFGLAIMLYFLNIIANISDSASFLKYITPFGYTDSADLIADGALDLPMLLVGAAFTAAGIAAAYVKYTRKNIGNL